jgi:hypothetical protein
LAAFLVAMVAIHQPVKRKQRHLELLRHRQASRVIERYGATVGNQLVDERDFAWLCAERSNDGDQGLRSGRDADDARENRQAEIAREVGSALGTGPRS